MHLVLVCIAQSLLSVGGSVLLRLAFKSSTLSFQAIVEACFSMRGAGGVVAMVLSFVLLVYGLSQYKPSVIIPVNTATSFVITIAFSYYFDDYRYTPLAIGGIMMIALGILLVSKAQ